jgi:2-dehydro-3-deoxyphosphogluconate aldolase/(4S)-4-hydroxy-2-oxoglutarate aldolase
MSRSTACIAAPAIRRECGAGGGVVRWQGRVARRGAGGRLRRRRGSSMIRFRCPGDEEATMQALFRGISVIPVLTIERERDAVPLARALCEGGLSLIEVTLRTPAAPAAIAAIGREVPQAVVGAGTLQRAVDVGLAVRAGARFLVSPGTTPELAAAALASDLPYLPGIATPSEIIAVRELGISFMKLFPAAPLGGVALLRALAPVFPGIAFCPTGGVDAASAADYLALPNVPVVGGSWMAPKDAVAAGDWPRIRRLAEAASALGRRLAA